MEDKLDVNEKYELLISTLNMVLFPIGEINVLYSDKLKNCLDELEGDYYTFLHENYVYELCETGIVSEKAFSMIKNIRLKIESISQSKWNVEDFVADRCWNDVRKLIIDLYLLDLKAN